MRLRSFTTYGFKSFADKTELTFDKGITAVVGPNGSGKSNISDAIRWVLGEQSARYLRGSKMEDVIFSGSSKRRALGVAEVTLEFDNSDRQLPLDFEQVSLTRRLFRSGESEYAINKKSCRLKDIIDLLADTGLGKGSLSIIGQNKIDEILNSRPEERRSIFEEAAGIARYRLRKKDAVRRLEDTGVNLTRINDIRSEVDAQVEPLAQAAAKTKRYQELNEEQRRCRLAVLLRRLAEMAAVTAKLQEKKLAAEQAFAQQAALLSSKEAEEVALQQQLDKLAEDFNRLQEAIKERETAMEKLRGQQNVLQERSAQSEKARQRLQQSDERLEQQLQEQEQRMQELAAAYDVAEKQRAAAAREKERLEQERGEQAALLEQTQQQSMELQSSFFGGMQELLKLRNELRALEQEQEQRRRRRESLKKSIDEAEGAASTAEQSYQQALERNARLEHEQERLRQEGLTLRQAYDQLQAELRTTQQQQQQCQRQLTAAETREQSLQRLQRAYEGFGYGIKNVLQADPARESWRSQLVGVAAELLQVEDKYVAAIETALGEGAQNLIMRSAAAAKEAIAFLKRSSGGRATFLPLDTVQRRGPSREEEALARLPGILGYAIDLVNYQQEAENALRFLLGRVLVAENIDAALRAAKAGHYRLRVVTLDGDVVNAGGSLSGGSRRHKEGFLSRASELKQAAQQVQELRRQMLSWQEQLEEQEERAQQQDKELERLRSELQRVQLQAGTLKVELQQLLQTKERLNEQLELLLEDRRQATEAYMTDRDHLRQLRTEVAEREDQDSEVREQLEQIKKRVAAAGSALTALDNQLQDASILLETSAAKTQLSGDNMRRLDQDLLQLRQQLTENQQEQERLLTTIESCSQQRTELGVQLEQLLKELQQELGGKDSFAQQRGELLTQQAVIEKAATELKQQAAASESRLRQAELELARHSSSCEHVEEQLQEEYQLDAASAQAEANSELQELPLAELQKRESKLSLQIAALGPINAAAIEEYQAILERSEFLRKQYDDLCEAKEKLETVIAEINSGMVKRFKEAFAAINAYFAATYVKLFGGGTALLRLTDPEDLLDSGIDIEVQPPGKKLQSLFLLSGGERALTVIALLFALLSYQPAPFCVLDEIDAALDDANIQRFAGFLRDYAAGTQFIVITHRKGTMESADIMYGVTMEESGVSKLLSVKINAKEKQ